MDKKLKGVQCTRCGARKTQTAEKKCKPERDYSDEWTCPMVGADTDDEGRFVRGKGFDKKIYSGVDLGCENGDTFAISIQTVRGAQHVPWPPGYPENGHGIEIALMGNSLICAHPAHPPYILDKGKWEKITPPHSPATAS